MRIKNLTLRFMLLPVLILPEAARGYDYSSLYDQAVLQKALQTYEVNLRGLWEEDFLSKLPMQEQKKPNGIRLELPLVGTNSSIFDYYTELESQRVVIPILSVKFFDDLATSWAWLERKGCNNQWLFQWVFDYVAVLRYQGPFDLHNGPRNTFSIPEDILSDEFIYDVSGKALKSTIYFIAAHEAGHLLYRHLPYAEVDSLETAQRQEMQADAFALDVLSRIGVAPNLLSLFFSVTTVFEPVNRSTHPLSSDRLLAVAEKIRQNVVQFARLQKDPIEWQSRLIEDAKKMKKLAEELQQIRRDIKRKGLATKPAQFTSACK